MTTIEYSNESTRGDYSSLSINPDGSDKEIESGLKREYITQWSYGIFESLAARELEQLYSGPKRGGSAPGERVRPVKPGRVDLPTVALNPR